MRDAMQDRHLPSISVAVVRDGRVEAQRSFGVANLEWQTAATDDTVYAVGSITKSMTAIVLMMLAEEGAIDLDSPASTYTPVMPEAWRSVSVRRLVTNQSGIPDFIENPCKHDGPAEYRIEDVIAEASCLPLEFEPGQRFSYSNTNFVLLGDMLARVTGKPLAQVFAERIFRPLGMTRTSVVDYETVLPSRADGYFWNGAAMTNVGPMDPVVEGGAGAVISTTSDMAIFMMALGSEKLLPKKGWDLMWTAPTVREGTTPYGYGFGVTPHEGRRRVGHGGAAPGFASAFSWFPDQGVGVVVLSNAYEEPHGRSMIGLANEIAGFYLAGETTR